MNVNEVIANAANLRLGGTLGAKSPMHPNDHVNMSQSSNDSIPTAMHIAAAIEIERHLKPALGTPSQLRWTRKPGSSQPSSSIGRTHTMDATPIVIGQEFSGYAAQVKSAIDAARTGAARTLPAGAGRHRGRHRDQPEAAICKGCRSSYRAADRSYRSSARRNKFEHMARHDAYCVRARRDQLAPLPLFTRLQTISGCLAPGRVPVSAN